MEKVHLRGALQSTGKPSREKRGVFSHRALFIRRMDLKEQQNNVGGNMERCGEGWRDKKEAEGQMTKRQGSLGGGSLRSKWRRGDLEGVTRSSPTRITGGRPSDGGEKELWRNLVEGETAARGRLRDSNGTPLRRERSKYWGLVKGGSREKGWHRQGRAKDDKRERREPRKKSFIGEQNR